MYESTLSVYLTQQIQKLNPSDKVLHRVPVASVKYRELQEHSVGLHCSLFTSLMCSSGVSRNSYLHVSSHLLLYNHNVILNMC